MEKIRRDSAGKPTADTREVRKRVKKVKLPTKPVTTPKARRRPPPKEEDRTIGRMGRIQGERMVTKPARKAKNVSRTITGKYTKKRKH
jgi:hypothetical protein